MSPCEDILSFIRRVAATVLCAVLVVLWWATPRLASLHPPGSSSWRTYWLRGLLGWHSCRPGRGHVILPIPLHRIPLVGQSAPRVGLDSNSLAEKESVLADGFSTLAFSSCSVGPLDGMFEYLSTTCSTTLTTIYDHLSRHHDLFSAFLFKYPRQGTPMWAPLFASGPQPGCLYLYTTRFGGTTSSSCRAGFDEDTGLCLTRVEVSYCDCRPDMILALASLHAHHTIMSSLS